MDDEVGITLFSDYVCPFCYVAWARVGPLEERLGIKVQWKSYELHSAAPEAGLPSVLHHNGDPRTKHVARQPRSWADAAGLTMHDNVPYANSRLAHELNAFAAEQGRGEAFRKSIFEAYFAQQRDIGEREVLLDVASDAGLDRAEAQRCLDERPMRDAVEAELAQSRALGITGVPTFQIGPFAIVGAQEVDSLAYVYRKAVEKQKSS